MGAVPTTNNVLVGTVEQAISLAMQGGASVAEALLIADFPWLGLPVVKQTLEFTLSYIEKYFYTAAANAAAKIVIDLQVTSEVTAAQTAFNDVQTAIAGGDQNAIKSASDALDASFASLVHSDGSASP